MKIKLSLKSQGNILVGAVIAMALMGLVLFSYLSMVGTQTKITARSQAWNSCIALAEAGVEEALAHLNKNGVSASGKIELGIDLAVQGWTKVDGTYFMRRAVGDADGYYETTIRPGARPVITSVGYMPAPVQTASSAGPIFAAKTDYPWESGKSFIKRTVQVTVRGIGKFNKAIVARDKVDLNGKRVVIDSYHSYDPDGSTYTNGATWGLYDPAKKRDRGDVAVIAGFHDDLEVHGGKVYGKVATGPEGDLDVKKNAAVGSLAWHLAGNLGVEPGWSSSDANFDVPIVQKPFTHGLGYPIGGLVDGELYDYIYTDGDYKVAQLKDKVYVSGNARILVTSKIEFRDGASDDDGIVLAPGAHLEIYMEGKEAKLVGKKEKKKYPLSEKTGFNRDGSTTNFFYFGLAKNEKLELKNMDHFSGIIYAPNAEITLKAGSLKYYHCELFGSIQGLRVKVEKNATMHYDENIGSLPADSFVVESWKEI